VHANVGNPALNTRPTILNHFFVNFYYFRDGLVKNLTSNIYIKISGMNEMQREILSLTQNKSGKMPLK
jgi:hypothetical protein